MGDGTSFAGGFLGSFGAALLQKEEREYDQQLEEVQGRRKMLELMASPGSGIDPQTQAQALQLFLTPSKGKGTKGLREQNEQIEKFVQGLKKLPAVGTPAQPAQPGIQATIPSGGETPLPAGVQQSPDIPQRAPSGAPPGAFRPEPLLLSAMPPARPQEISTSGMPAREAVQGVYAPGAGSAASPAATKLQEEQQTYEERKRQADELGLRGLDRVNYIAGRQLEKPPAEPQFKLAYGAAIPGDQLPPDAQDLKGDPILPERRTKDSQWKMYKYGESFRYEPAQASAKATRTKEQIQAEIADAFKKGDKASVKRLQDEMKAIDPLAEQRINVTLGREGSARSDKSFQYNNTELEKAATPVDQMASRMGRLMDTLNQHNPQADALVAPELLSVMAGGQGSGVRMNEAEIARIVGGRSAWESLKAAIQHWSTDPNAARSITPDQDKQIRALAQTVQSKLLKKQAIIDQARQALVDSDEPRQHRQIVAKAHKQLDDVDAGAGTQTTGGPPNRPSGPVKGTRKQNSHGDTMEWDGTQWKPVKIAA